MIKRIIPVLLALFCSEFAYSQLDEILRVRNRQFDTETSNIFPVVSGYEEGSLQRLKKADDKAFERWLKANYLDLNAESQQLASDPNIFLDDFEDVDQRKQNDLLRLTYKNFRKPIVLDSGIEVMLEFGETDDGVYSDLPVSELLIKGLKEALETANAFLKSKDVPPITKLFISSTTNGVHGPNSNHYKKEAVDIAKINGRSIYNTRRSQKRKERAELIASLQGKELKDYESYGNISIENVYFDVDDIYLHDRVKALQSGIAYLKYYRENFGPVIKFKYTKGNDKTNYAHPIGKHEGHIHFSVR